MPSPIKHPRSSSSRVECCGPHGPEHLIVSWITADKECWVIFPKPSPFPDNCLPRRSFLGVCRRCAEVFKWTS